MTKLYHYITKGNNALKQGILSFANNPQADLHYYYKRTGGETTHSGIVKWMENCFEGRSRAIRGFSEPIQWTEKSINMFKPFIANADLFSVDLETLQKDGLIEAIYVSPAIRPNLDKDFPQDVDERLVRLASINDIDTSPVDWSVCDEKLGLLITCNKLRPNLDNSEAIKISSGFNFFNNLPSFRSSRLFLDEIVSSIHLSICILFAVAKFSISKCWFSLFCFSVLVRTYP